MTSCTPIYQLPYITGSDRACDQDATWCAFADAVEARLDVFDLTIARTYTAIPMAKVTKSEPQTIQPQGATVFTAAITFDTVAEDTDDLVDLTAFPYGMTINRTGLYMARCYMEMATSTDAAASYQFQLRWQGPPAAIGSTIPISSQNHTIGWNDVTTPAFSMNYVLSGMFRTTRAGSLVYATIDYGALPASVRGSITRAELDIEWISD